MAISNAAFNSELRNRISEEVYNSLFAPLKLVRVENGVAFFRAPSDFVKNWIAEHYSEHLAAAAKRAYGVKRIRWMVGSVSLELARKLKGEGFPQSTSHFFYNASRTPPTLESTDAENDRESKVYKTYAVPSVDLLMDACGDEHLTLQGSDMNGWSATYGNTPRKVEVAGETKDEAMARLWLAINEEKPPS